MEAIKQFKAISNRRLKPKGNGDKYGHVILSESSTYCPYDFCKLLARIQTYPTGFINSNGFNQLICSMNGWIWIGTDRLKCIHCLSMISTKIPTVDGEDFDDVISALLLRYVEDLNIKHYRNCPWSIKATPAEVYEINELNEAELNDFLERYKESFGLIEHVDKIQIVSRLDPNEIAELESFIELNDLIFDPIIAEISVLGWIFQRINNTFILYSKSDSRKLPLINESVDLIEEHEIWDRFHQYKKLFKIIKFNLNKDNLIEINKFDYEVDDNEINEAELIEIDENQLEINKKLQSSLHKLENLKKIYF